jgi:hypothetical protein
MIELQCRIKGTFIYRTGGPVETGERSKGSKPDIITYAYCMIAKYFL